MILIYIVGFVIILGFSLYAQGKVKSNYKKYSRVMASSGMSGAEAAMEMLSRAGVYNVGVERTHGFLSDHYDPRRNVIKLSPEVYEGRSLSSVGIACHEAGHAIQKANNYAPLVIRNMAVPAAAFGSQAGIWILIGGLLLNVFALQLVGLVLFGAVAVFQVINLPVEFDASRRAKHQLISHNIIHHGSEEKGVSKVLDAAAMTYVAATVAALFTFLYYALLVFGGRR